jgi:hypothetical protein
MNTPPHPSPADLRRFADLIQGQARRLANLATWRDDLDRHLSAIQAGESPGGADYQLRLIQARRDSGDDADVAFFRIAWLAHRWADDAFVTDEKLSEIDDKMEKIRAREDSDWDLDDPDAPDDFKRLARRWSRRIRELEHVQEGRFIRFLLAHGETDMAAFYQCDRAAFDRSYETGRCIVFGPQPDISTGSGHGDTGLTQVATGEE